MLEDLGGILPPPLAVPSSRKVCRASFFPLFAHHLVNSLCGHCRPRHETQDSAYFPFHILERRGLLRGSESDDSLPRRTSEVNPNKEWQGSEGFLKLTYAPPTLGSLLQPFPGCQWSPIARKMMPSNHQSPSLDSPPLPKTRPHHRN